MIKKPLHEACSVLKMSQTDLVAIAHFFKKIEEIKQIPDPDERIYELIEIISVDCKKDEFKCISEQLMSFVQNVYNEQLEVKYQSGIDQAMQEGDFQAIVKYYELAVDFKTTRNYAASCFNDLISHGIKSLHFGLDPFKVFTEISKIEIKELVTPLLKAQVLQRCIEETLIPGEVPKKKTELALA